MELTTPQKDEVESIIDRMYCPCNFKCFHIDKFDNNCKASVIGYGGGLTECLGEDGNRCKFSFLFGDGNYCKCPLRSWAAKNLGR